MYLLKIGLINKLDNAVVSNKMVLPFQNRNTYNLNGEVTREVTFNQIKVRQEKSHPDIIQLSSVLDLLH